MRCHANRKAQRKGTNASIRGGISASNKGSKQKGVDLSNYLGVISGTFGSAQEIDDYIKKKREAWDQNTA